MALFGKRNKEQKNTKPKQDNVLNMVKDNGKAKNADAEQKKENKENSPKPSKDNTGDAYKILTRPTVSEKAYKLVAAGKYTFKVNPSANKISVRKAIERVYDVKVARVNIIRTPGKAKSSGRISGKRSASKKAIVTLKAGEQITL